MNTTYFFGYFNIAILISTVSQVFGIYTSTSNFFHHQVHEESQLTFHF